MRLFPLFAFLGWLGWGASPVVASSATSVTPGVSTNTGLSKTGSEITVKNLARLHVGTTLERFDSETKYYLPDPSAEAWLDEDDTTKFTLPTGTQWYLITLEDPALIQNFSLASDLPTGKVSLYACDQKSLPGSKNWQPLFQGVSTQEVNEKMLPKPLFRYAKYFLMETRLEKPMEVSSLYLFTDGDAVNYRILKRPQRVNFSDKIGPYFKDLKRQVNFAGRYARSPLAGALDQNIAAMVDESPETTGSLDSKPTVVDLSENRSIEQVTIFAEKKKGTIQISLEGDATMPANTAAFPVPDLIKMMGMIGWGKTAAFFVQANGNTPSPKANALVRTIEMTGQSDRFTVGIPPTTSRFLTIQWTSGDNPPTPLKIKNFAAMGYLSLNDYTVSRGFMSLTGNAPEDAAGNTGATSEGTELNAKEVVGTTTTGSTAGVRPEQVLGNGDTDLRLPPVTPVSN